MEAQLIPVPTIHRELADGISFFFAVLPDDQARSAIAGASERFRKSHRVSGALVGTDSLHLAICPTGRPERPLPSLEGALLAAAGAVRACAFDITLDSAMRFSVNDGRFPFVLCADSSSASSALTLRQTIAEEQRRAGLVVTGVSSYLPHVTLLHGHAVDAIQESIVPVRWTVREFVLIRCFFGQARQEVVERWPLEPVPATRLAGALDFSDLPDLGELPEDE
ncbi:2'-5' RNA ligase family protein [Rhodanobacter koreensis]